MLAGKEIFCDNEEKMISDKSSPISQSPNHESNSEFFGPALPLHLLKKNKENSDNHQKIYGPILPHSFRQVEKNFKGELDFTDLEVDKKIEEYVIIGPEIPEHLKLPEHDETKFEKEQETDISSKNVNSKCNDYIGPSVNLMSTDSSHSYKFIKSKSTNEKTSDFQKKRESWMLELPEKKPVSFDKSKRHFKTRSYTDQEDRSVWTNTPTEKGKEKDKKKEKDYCKLLKMKKLEERDKEMKLLIETSKKKQPNLSLLEMHLKKLNKKKKQGKKLEKEKGESKIRRSFDRNVDLQIHRIDENQKRCILNKATFLNDRFAAGESKFL